MGDLPQQWISASSHPALGCHWFREAFRMRTIKSGGSLSLTDGQGRFQLPPDPTVRRVVAAGPQGYGEATPAEMANDPVIAFAALGSSCGNVSSRRTTSGWSNTQFQYDEQIQAPSLRSYRLSNQNGRRRTICFCQSAGWEPRSNTGHDRHGSGRPPILDFGAIAEGNHSFRRNDHGHHRWFQLG